MRHIVTGRHDVTMTYLALIVNKTALFKKGNRFEPGNCRSVSLTGLQYIA